MNEEILDHPLVRVIRGVMKRGADEPFVLDSDGALLVQYGLLRYAGDPSLPDAVLGLFAMATGLFKHGRSPGAARSLLEILAACRERLPELAKGANRETLRRLENAFESLGAEKSLTAPAIDSPVPPGSIKASSFSNPGMQKPR
jgi:hypothetical protein